MRRPRTAEFVILFGALFVVAGCASKKYVTNQVNPIDTRVSELETTTEDQGERLDAIDRRLQQGIAAADSDAVSAQATADMATDSAASAQATADVAADAASVANDRITALEAQMQLAEDYQVAGTVSLQFALNSDALSDDAAAALDVLASQIQDGDLIAIQGYTDSTGEASSNLALSQRRADAVQRGLVERDVSLFQMSTVGMGDANPVADNSTRTGREMNRRVEIQLLRAVD